MAKLVLTDVITTIGGTDYSANINQVEISVSADEVDTTAFGSSGGWRTSTNGLKSGTFTVSFHQDFAAAAIDSALWGLFGSAATVVVKPAGTAVSSSNPSFSFVANISNLTPVSGAVGDLAVSNVTWPITGAVTRATA
jgi:predicted secreted protein